MWIIPSNLPESSAFVQEYLESKEDLLALESTAVSWPMWKSNPSSALTFVRLWNRVWWIPRLFGRMLKPSMHDRFIEKYTDSLEDILALASPGPGYEKAMNTRDSFGRIYAELSKQQNLFGVSLKTWTTTLRERSRLFCEAYEIWVTQLRREYILRQKRALHKKGNACLFWPSPRASEWKGSGQKGSKSQIYRLKKAYLDATVIEWSDGQKDKDMSNMTGSHHVQLSVEWTAQLMGTSLDRIFFMQSETAL
jgi:hypothetical protein